MATFDPEELYELDADLPELSGAVLLILLDGFVDAGSAVATARAHLLEGTSGRVVARFDVDQLFDYRARRPMMHFDEDHWTSFDAPQLSVQLLADVEGSPFSRAQRARAGCSMGGLRQGGPELSRAPRATVDGWP